MIYGARCLQWKRHGAQPLSRKKVVMFPFVENMEKHMYIRIYYEMMKEGREICIICR
jgi:hypothetical protein